MPPGSPTRMLRHPAAIAIGLVVALPLLAGCGAIFGQRYENFTAYYNAFYNARRDFDRAERDILRANDPVDRTRFLSVFPRGAQPGARQGSGQQAFEAAIRRAADVLREHPGSRWTDDALLLIGKSYFYQGNFDAAAQKFREVLMLEEGRLSDEAHLWLGRALMEARDYGEAAAVLRRGLERPEAGARWSAQLRLALAENDLRRGDLENAATGLRNGLEDVNDALVGARAAFLLGQVFDGLGKFDDAITAYERALALRPQAELTFAAEVQRALALSRADRTDEALARLERLRRDDRYFQQRAEVELIRARALVAAARDEEAHLALQRLLYQRDPNIRIDRVRGPIHYHLAEVYRDHRADFARAAAHFDTAATVLNQAVLAARDVQTTREALLDAERQAQSYGSYARVSARIAEMDSLLHLGSLDDQAFAAAIETIGERRRQEALVAERERRRIEDQQGFGQGPVAAGSALPGDDVGAGGSDGQQAGFLSFRNPVRVQENLIAFQSRWGDRPHVANWRRASAVTAAIASANGNGAAVGPDELRPQMTAMTNGFVDVSAIPRSPEARSEMRAERALARYELGNVLFLTLNDPSAAADWYLRVVEEDGALPVAARARYALAEVHTALGDSAAAEALLRDITQMPDDDPLARAARERLGQPAPPPPPDSLELASRAYAASFQQWQDGHHRDALRGMLQVADDFSGFETAARARLAAGMIYTEWAASDTLHLLAYTPEALVGSQPEDVPQQVMIAADRDGSGAGELDEVNTTDFQQEENEVADDAASPTELEAPDATLDEVGTNEEEGTNANTDTDATALGETYFPQDLLAHAGDRAARDTINGIPADILDEHPPDPDLPTSPERSWLEELYHSIEVDFPGTPFAERARRMRLVVEEQRHALAALDEPDAPEEDPDETVPSDEPIDSGLLPLHQAAMPDDQADPADRGYDEPQDPDGDRGEDSAGFAPEMLMGGEPVVASRSGFSWVVLTTPREAEAQHRLVAFHNRGYRAAMMTDDDADAGRRYLVLVGQFATEEEAMAARTALPLGTDLARAHIVALTPDLSLRTADDLVGQ